MTDEDTEGEKLPTEEERESDLGSDTEELPRRSCQEERENVETSPHWSYSV